MYLLTEAQIRKIVDSEIEAICKKAKVPKKEWGDYNLYLTESGELDIIIHAVLNAENMTVAKLLNEPCREHLDEALDYDMVTHSWIEGYHKHRKDCPVCWSEFLAECKGE